MPKMPTWKPPKNIVKALEDGDGTWEDERWSPILLTLMSGVEYDGRDIPVSWQIEFEPFGDEFEKANAKLEEIDIKPDGDGWGEFITQAIGESNPALANRLHLDCESSTCVIWVETEEDCRKLLETTWGLIFNKTSA
jgi:hypothetical protein